MDNTLPIWIMPNGKEIEQELPPEGFIGLKPNGAPISKDAFPVLYKLMQKLWDSGGYKLKPFYLPTDWQV